MNTNIYSIIIGMAVILAICAGAAYFLLLMVKTMRAYIKSQELRREKTFAAKSLGAVLKEHRIECKMTQEFVAEALFVSRQAVSKWESGASTPNTANLIAIAKLYGVAADALLKETSGADTGAQAAKADGGAQA